MLFNNIKDFNKISITSELQNDVLQCCEIEVKYIGYIEREKHYANKALKFDKLKIPISFNFNKISSLSTEARQKLSKIKPKTIGQASRIPGVSPSDINILLVFLGR